MNLENSLRFFDSAHENFLATVSHSQGIKRFYKVAGFTVCLYFAGAALVDFLTPALQHLQTEDEENVALTICIWDGVSTGAPSLEFPWPRNSFALHGNVIGYDNERVHTVFDAHLKILQVFHKERNLALYWIQDLQKTPWWIGTSPLLFILHWWMNTKGYQLTHAGAVGYPEAGILFAGKSGAGKSTTSLSCMKAGMKYVSEDYCVLSDAPEIRAHSLYNSAKITEKTAGLFPELRQYIENPEHPKEDKAFFFHHKFQPNNILSSFPLKALITLKIFDAQDSWLEPIEPSDALAALSATTLWQLSHTGPSVFKHLRRVAEALPCYRLHLGRDLAQPPKLIERLLTCSNQKGA